MQKKMELVSRVQILSEAVCIHFTLNTLSKGMNPLLPQLHIKISFGEGQFYIEIVGQNNGIQFHYLSYHYIFSIKEVVKSHEQINLEKSWHFMNMELQELKTSKQKGKSWVCRRNNSDFCWQKCQK